MPTLTVVLLHFLCLEISNSRCANTGGLSVGKPTVVTMFTLAKANFATPDGDNNNDNNDEDVRGDKIYQQDDDGGAQGRQGQARRNFSVWFYKPDRTSL